MNNYEIVTDFEGLERISAKKQIPFTGSIEIITKCNFNCIHCYIPEHVNQMDTEIIFQTIDAMKKMGIFELTLTGGEIFLHKDIMQIIEYARKKGMRVTLFSNISLIDEIIAKRLSELYISEISTTIFSLDGEINDRITQKSGSLFKILKAIEYIKKYNIELEIKVPIMKQNKNAYSKIREFCKNNKIKVSYSTAITQRTNGDKEPCKYKLDFDECCEWYKYNDSKIARRPFGIEEHMCNALCNSVHIDVNGNVYPCISFPYIIGNIYANDLYSIWKKSDERKRLLMLKKKDLKSCTKCELKEYCVRCPGLAYAENGDMLGCSTIDREIAIARQW